MRVFADIKKKHSAHAITADVSLVETAQAAEFFLADGVIVTGTATGHPADAVGGPAAQPPSGFPRSSVRASRPRIVTAIAPPTPSSSDRRSSRMASGQNQSTRGGPVSLRGRSRKARRYSWR